MDQKDKVRTTPITSSPVEGVSDKESKDSGEEETKASAKKVLRYPWHVGFILGNEFCERYSYYGMNSILSMYLKKKLFYSETEATIITHTFKFICYFTALFGATLADQYIGKFRTIFYLSLVYVAGHIIKTVGSMTNYSSIPHEEFSLIGLAIIAVGTGGIKPCVAAFAGDQFKLPEQEEELQQFFAIFYLTINIGSLISMLVGPQLRSIHCLGEDSCYPLAFGVPAILMFIATVIIVAGKSFYTINPTEGVLCKSLGIVWSGLTSCCKRKKAFQHWLDPAKEKYEDELIDEVKFLFGVDGILLLFTPIIFFWCLFDQISTTWTYQAENLYGLLPDQVQFINSALILILIPTFQYVIYPTFAKFNLLVKPLQRMTVGMFLGALAFLIAGILELIIQENPFKTIHVLWQVPQYFMLTCGEVMVSITGLEFAYNQAAPSMKSILQAYWSLIIGGGNLITVIISAIGDFENRAHGIFLFAGLMLVSSCIFTFLAWRYTPRELEVKAKEISESSEDLEKS